MRFAYAWVVSLVCLLVTVVTPLPIYAAPPAQQSAAVPVYGVQGHFEVLSGQTFGEVFVGADGTRLTATGADATVAQQIDVLARQSPPPLVRVWGTRNFDPKPAYTADLVVSEILPEGDAAQPAPETAANPVTAVVNYSLVNLYNTPSQSMSVVGQARAGEQCAVEARDASGAGLLVDCGNSRGWIDRRLVNVTGSLESVPISSSVAAPQPPTQPLQPTPTPAALTPPPPPVDAWRASYYNNPTLNGALVAYQDLPAIDLNWGYGSPATAVPVDYFSATIERTYSFPQGYYSFSVLADDGVRVYVDNDLVINEWHQASGQTYTAIRPLSGVHRLRIEYLELVGVAAIRFTLGFSTAPPPWQATYYEGAPNRGPQRAVQGEQAGARQLDRTWGDNSPFPGILPADGWNGRWAGQFTFSGGNYYFRARADDGVRVYLNDTLVINGWSDGAHDLSNAFRNVGPGTHTITVDYYDRYGYAYLQVFWYADQFGPNYVP
jgi:hypothetical protein